MRPLLHPTLLNGRFGDPALYVETLFEKHAILFDLGDISALPPRKIQRIEHVFVSHAHIDHFIGFDRLLRVLAGREKQVNLYGPPGFIDRVGHKLQAYQWNLVDRCPCDLIFLVTEVGPGDDARASRFRLKTAFAAEDMGRRPVIDGVIFSAPTYKVSAATLEHRIPCLGFAIEEMAHVNIWKSRLTERGLLVGPWLHAFKQAVVENKPDDFLIHVGERSETSRRAIPLGALRDALTITAGQKIVYVTDVSDTPENGKAIVRLAQGADLLFIEATFAKADAKLAADRAHLTTEAAGRLAREAGARRVEPFHFSTRYEGHESEMVAEVMAAFAGADAMRSSSARRMA
jgi:ribonuclease Z